MTGKNPIKRNRMILLLIGGIPVIVVLVATWLWFFVVRGDIDLVAILGTANRGELVQPPRQLEGLALYDESGTTIKFADMEPRWSMVVPAPAGRCDEACEKSLYTTRQIHVAMGKYFNDLRRFFISEESAENTELVVQELSDGHPAPAEGSFSEYLQAEHRGLQALTLSPADYNALFQERAADASTWYLVDPAGWVMMSYNEEVSYKDVIADLKFLIKNSGG
jgi:hypothetical protein